MLNNVYGNAVTTINTFNIMRRFYYLFFLLLASSAVAFGMEVNYVFTDSQSAQDWTSVDSDGDGVTWGVTADLSGIAYLGNTTSSSADDWLFSPEISLEANRDYILEYAVSLRGVFGDVTVDVVEGTSADNAQLLGHEVYSHHSGIVARRSHVRTGDQGTLSVGFHLQMPPANGVVSLKSVRVIETTPQKPEPVPAMALVPMPSEKKVKVKWINPEYDCDGARIRGDLYADILAGDYDYPIPVPNKPGQECEYVITPATYAGSLTVGLSVAAGLESERVSQTIDLDDAFGDETEVKAFSLSNKTAFQEWTVVNADAGQTWAYDYGSVYMSGSSKGCDDWIITPSVHLEPGVRYLAKYKLKSAYQTYYADLDVTFGAGTTAESQSTVIASYRNLLQNGYGDYVSNQFEVSEEGDYNIGFHALYVGNSLDIKDVSVYSISTGGAVEEPILTVPARNEDVALDNVNGDLSLKADYHTRMSMPGVELYAAFTQAQLDEYTNAPDGIFALPAEKEYTPTLTSPVIATQFSGGVVYHEGKIYCNAYNSKNNIQAEVPHWQIYDAKTFELLTDVELESNCVNTTVTMAYDRTQDVIYGLVKDYTDTWFVSIDPQTGAMARISGPLDFHQKYLSLACDSQGQLFILYLTEDYYTGDQMNYLARIDKQTGEISTIGAITGVNMMADDLLVNMKYRQALFFDNSTGKMFWLFGSSSRALGMQYAPIFEVNPINANAVLRTWLKDVKAISGAYFVEPSLDAPAVISNFEYVAESAGANSGVLKFDLPSVTYSGKPLSGEVNYLLTEIDGSLQYSGTGAPGERISLAVASDENRMHNFDIVASNDAGNSPVVNYGFLIGFDEPAAPTDIKLSDIDLTATLTWSAPTIGVNGYPFDASKLTYTIVRYPGEVTVAENVTECTWSETLPSSLNRYIYAVYSCADGKRCKGELSNAEVIGSPINPPFGGVFGDWTDMYNYYSVRDENNDGYTWVYDETSRSALYPYNYREAANDWLISPPLNLEKGAEYELTFGALSSNYNFLESLKVMLGTYKTADAMTTELLDIPEVPTVNDDNSIAMFTVPISVDASGVYYYGFQAYSPAYYEYLYLYNIKLSVTKESGIGCTQLVDGERVMPIDGGLRIANPQGKHVRVYSMAGTLLGASDEDQFDVTLSKGIYVVDFDGQSVKAAVTR